MIYIASPAKYATGGTELLHQLYFEIRKYTNRVLIFYYDFDGLGSPTADRFLKYGVEFVTEIDDNIKNLLIVPEISSGIELVNAYYKVKKIIWWLSVDNYLLSNQIGIFRHLLEEDGYKKVFIYVVKRFVKEILFKSAKTAVVDFDDENIIHLYQSEYAKEFLENKGVKLTESLSDYINDDIISFEPIVKEKILLYNPSKGTKITSKILKNIKTLNHIAIRGMTIDELRNIYSKSMVYIDFGYHPGKDRIPREAGVNGNLVITSLKGSALNNIDIQIPPEYKFDTKNVNPKKIATLIEKYVLDYENRINHFTLYREKILQEKVIFQDNVNTLFKNVFIHYNDEV